MVKLLKYAIFINALVTSTFYMISLLPISGHISLILMWTSATMFAKYAMPLYIGTSLLEKLLFNYLEKK